MKIKHKGYRITAQVRICADVLGKSAPTPAKYTLQEDIKDILKTELHKRGYLFNISEYIVIGTDEI
tara:strand:+ start:91 stop:288 length:198 start_codon:yes stop_codon:yes gene_type:complete